MGTSGGVRSALGGCTGELTPRFWPPTTPPTNRWLEAPFGGGGGSGRGEGGLLPGGGGCPWSTGRLRCSLTPKSGTFGN